MRLTKTTYTLLIEGQDVMEAYLKDIQEMPEPATGHYMVTFTPVDNTQHSFELILSDQQLLGKPFIVAGIKYRLRTNTNSREITLTHTTPVFVDHTIH